MTVEEAQALKHSQGWEALCKEIDRKIDAIKDKLITCPSSDLYRCQEEVKALMGLKTLPQDIIDRES